MNCSLLKFLSCAFSPHQQPLLGLQTHSPAPPLALSSGTFLYGDSGPRCPSAAAETREECPEGRAGTCLLPVTHHRVSCSAYLLQRCPGKCLKTLPAALGWGRVGPATSTVTVCARALVVRPSLALGVLDPLGLQVALGPSLLSGRTHCSRLRGFLQQFGATVTVVLRGQSRGVASGR